MMTIYARGLRRLARRNLSWVPGSNAAMTAEGTPPMLAALATLLVCQLAGEAIVRAAALPLPGPVIGMALLFFVMLARAPLPKELGSTADTLLRHLSLLFVPAGVGVVQNLAMLGHEGAQLIAVVVLATVITLAVTALTFEYLARTLGVDETDAEQEAGEQ